MQKSSDVPRIDAGPATVHWGFFDAKIAPLLTIGSGERVTISSVSGSPETLPPPEEVVKALVPLCLPSFTESGKLYDYRAGKLLEFKAPA